MDDDPADAELTAAVSVVLDTFGLAPCPGNCDRLTPRTVSGHRSYCLRCTEQSIGLGMAENGRRIEAKMSIAAWLKRPVDEPWPEPRASVARRRLNR